MGIKRKNRYAVKQEYILDRDNIPFFVSTIWEEGYRGERRYETMVFPARLQGGWGELLEVDCERYKTEAEARNGHERIKRSWRNSSNKSFMERRKSNDA